MESQGAPNFDAIVVGGGIAGLQAALDLAAQDFTVAVIEKDASIGGKMIRLSKVFPTLDCASCITTPKMAAASHHDRISLFTCCDVRSLERQGDGLVVRVTRRPRYVDAAKCIGCRKCEYACPSYVPDEEQGGLTLRKAIRVPFSTAIPQVALIDLDHCALCGACAKICPTQAVDYGQEPKELVIRAGTAILATGFKLMSLAENKEYGRGEVPNVITSLQMERLLAPHGPYQRVIRPADGKEPASIAYVQCAGSRDRSHGVPYCSRVCCMYAIKQAMLLAGALPLADITIYYMDIRAFGKGYEQFYQNARAMGIEFVKAKVGTIRAGSDQNVIVRYEAQEEGRVVTREHDLVVLSLAILPDWSPEGVCQVPTAEDAFIRSVLPDTAPTVTGMEGVLVAGTAAGPKDIVDTIAEAGAAAMEAANYLRARAREGYP